MSPLEFEEAEAGNKSPGDPRRVPWLYVRSLPCNRMELNSRNSTRCHRALLPLCQTSNVPGKKSGGALRVAQLVLKVGSWIFVFWMYLSLAGFSNRLQLENILFPSKEEKAKRRRPCVLIKFYCSTHRMSLYSPQHPSGHTE